ncbi:MAG: O-antigen ligase family protein [Proteobacteria bacterium]|nr:O-antigen ligase family protein [Pseudomonadota bacterium]
MAPLASFWNDPDGISPPVFLLAAAVAIGALLLGGGAGWLGDTVVQLLSLPLFVLSGLEWRRQAWKAGDWMLLALIGGVLLLGALQLMPISADVWARLPGRAELLADLHAAGLRPVTYSLSLNPVATERSLLWLLPAVAMLLATRWMSWRQTRVLLIVLFATIIFLLGFGVMSKTATNSDVLATVRESVAQTNLALNSISDPNASAPAAPVDSGFAVYSNRNHFATLLAMTIPLALGAALAVWRRSDRDKKNAFATQSLMFVLVLIGLLIGVVETKSRSGFVLGPAALAAGLLMFPRMGLSRKLTWLAVGGVLAIVAIAVILVGSGTLDRFFTESADLDLRWGIHATTLDAARHFGVLGSGLGTFVEAYQQVVPHEGYLAAYVNHAHGDYHELWLETGWPGAALLIAFLGWYLQASFKAWTRKSTDAPVVLARAASIAILVVLAHSYLEYPLRKTAILALMGVVCGLLQAGAQRNDKQRTALPSPSVRGQREAASDAASHASGTDAPDPISITH